MNPPPPDNEGFAGPSRMHIGGLRSSSIKLFRAREHMGQLQAAIQIYTEVGAFAFRAVKDSATGEQVLYMKVAMQPPVTITTLVSDCVHNLRQSLDHLAYELAVSASGSDPPPNAASAAFPITKSLQAFNSTLRGKIGNPEKIPSDVLATLTRFQPFSGPEGQSLAVLRDLDDRAKHRALPVVAGVAMATGAQTEGENIKLNALHTGPVGVGETEIARFEIKKSGVDVQSALWTEINTGIIFGDESPGAGENVVGLLETTYQLIATEVQPELLGSKGKPSSS